MSKAERKAGHVGSRNAVGACRLRTVMNSDESRRGGLHQDESAQGTRARVKVRTMTPVLQLGQR